jgi:hypothetical protein
MFKKTIIGATFVAMNLVSAMAADDNQTSYYSRGKLIEVEKTYTERSLDGSAVKYYTTSRGEKVGVTDEILVKCKADRDCYDVIKKYNFKEIKKINSFLFKVKVKDDKDVFRISRELYEDENIAIAHPNFTRKIKRR